MTTCRTGGAVKLVGDDLASRRVEQLRKRRGRRATAAKVYPSVYKDQSSRRHTSKVKEKRKGGARDAVGASNEKLV